MTILTVALALIVVVQFAVIGLYVLPTRRRLRNRVLEIEAERLRAQLERSQRLESVGQLAGGVAHDFNNLLAVILNYASFVLDDLPEDDPRREDVAEIKRAAESARDLTHQLLVFSRRELALPEVVDVGRALESARNLLRRTIGEHIELSISSDIDLWRTTLGAGQIEQVLVNLAVNARDAMPAGGRLEIDVRNVELDTGDPPEDLPRGAYLRLRVRDDGEGMAAEAAERAFDPFFTTKPVGKGTGLGLATIYGIVTRAAGAIEIDSEPGRGTAVTIHLPATSDVVGDGGPPSGAARSGAGVHVLVVEDESAVRALTVRSLRDQGYEVSEARDGAEALERCRAAGRSLDLLVTDVVMPGMSGMALAEQAREISPGLAVLFVSGYAQAESPPGLLLKPYSREALLGRVEDTLRERFAVRR